MQGIHTHRFGLVRLWVRVIAFVAVVLAWSGGGALAFEDGAGPSEAVVRSIPAGRQADRVVVITVRGGIDRITALSVRRRIAAAERAGFDAMVLEIDSPGGELGAVLDITNAIKGSSISNSVAWVHPDAYSGGAIVALACNEIVTSDPASFGDAFIVQMTGMGLRALSPDERTKLLPALMADVVDSARRSGYDEFLVQAIVADGIELWQVENIESGDRLTINEQEYRMLFDGEPIRGRPLLAQVTGGVKTYRERPAVGVGKDGAGEEDGAEKVGSGSDGAGEGGGLEETDPGQAGGGEGFDAGSDPNAYRPASETLDDVAREFASSERGIDLALQHASDRVVLRPADKGAYRFVGYVNDGSSAVVLRQDQMESLGFSSGVVENDEDLASFFGAEQLVRVNESMTERAVRFMVHPFVRGVLIVILLLAIFVEMLMGGTGIAGGVAIGALALLIGPGALIGLSGWWEIIAIVAGLICLALEAFVIPGFGVFGVVGFVLLFGGLVATFVSSGGSLSSPAMQQQLLTGSVTVFLSLVTAGIGWWLIVRNAQNLPLFDRLIHSTASGVGGMPAKSMLHAIVADDGSVRVGSEGVTTTPLYPVGQADFEGRLEDVHAAFGFVERGVRVRVVRASAMRIEVESIDDDGVGDA